MKVDVDQSMERVKGVFLRLSQGEQLTTSELLETAPHLLVTTFGQFQGLFERTKNPKFLALITILASIMDAWENDWLEEMVSHVNQKMIQKHPQVAMKLNERKANIKTAILFKRKSKGFSKIP